MKTPCTAAWNILFRNWIWISQLWRLLNRLLYREAKVGFNVRQVGSRYIGQQKMRSRLALDGGINDWSKLGLLLSHVKPYSQQAVPKHWSWGFTIEDTASSQTESKRIPGVSKLNNDILHVALNIPFRKHLWISELHRLINKLPLPRNESGFNVRHKYTRGKRVCRTEGKQAMGKKWFSSVIPPSGAVMHSRLALHAGIRIDVHWDY